MVMQPMSTVYYNFYLNMWIMRRVTADTLQAKFPKYLTQEECDMILASPQIEEVVTP
jgi:hypothetical protein